MAVACLVLLVACSSPTGVDNSCAIYTPFRQDTAKQAVLWTLALNQSETTRTSKSHLIASFASLARLPCTTNGSCAYAALVVVHTGTRISCADLVNSTGGSRSYWPCTWLSSSSVLSAKRKLHPGRVYLVEATGDLVDEDALERFRSALAAATAGRNNRRYRQDMNKPVAAIDQNLRFVAVDRLSLLLGLETVLYVDCDVCIVGPLEPLFGFGRLHRSSAVIVANRSANSLHASWNPFAHATPAQRHLLWAQWHFDASTLAHQFNAGIILVNVVAYCQARIFERMIRVAQYLRTHQLLMAPGNNNPLMELAVAAGNLSVHVGEEWNCRYKRCAEGAVVLHGRGSLIPPSRMLPAATARPAVLRAKGAGATSHESRVL